MSMTNLLTSMDEEVRVSTVATSAKNAKVVWSKEMERKLIDLFLEQIQLGRKGEGGFKKEAWTAIQRKFNEEMKMNLGKDNFKNKYKTWKQGYRMMKELRNMSGFAWNESTQCLDADDSVWEELLKRKDLKNARVYKRQPFTHFNDLGVIFGNDIADGNGAATGPEAQDGQLFEEAVDLDDDGGFGTHMDGTPQFDEEIHHSNNSTTSVRQNPSPPSARKSKRKKPSMASSLEIICEGIQNIDRGMTKSHNVNLDKREVKHDISSAFAALKAMPGVSRGTLIVAYDFFSSEPTKASAFLEMNAEEREEYIRYKFGGVF